MVENQTLYCKINCTLEKLNFPSIKETNDIIDNYYRNLKNFKKNISGIISKSSKRRTLKLDQFLGT